MASSYASHGAELLVGVQDDGDDHYRDLASKVDLLGLRREWHRLVDENREDKHNRGALHIPLVEALGHALGIKHAKMGFLGIHLEGHEKQALRGITSDSNYPNTIVTCLTGDLPLHDTPWVGDGVASERRNDV